MVAGNVVPLAERRFMKPSLDIIIPVYNEVESIPHLVDTLETVFSLDNRERHLIGQVRYVFVDDGSTDDSLALLERELTFINSALILSLSRNFGHQSALSAGIDFCKSDLVSIIDADLQDPPELILEMIKKWREGFEVVSARRTKRKEGLAMVFAYWSFYRLLKILSPIPLEVDSGDFCLMSRIVVRQLKSLTETMRFHRTLRSWVGFQQTTVSYERPSRVAGVSKYSIRRLYGLATDGIASISIFPLKVAQLIALIYFLFSVGTLLPLLFGHHSYCDDKGILVSGYLALVLGQGVIFLILYVMGAYVGRTYLEVKARPPYVLKRIIVRSGK